MKLFRPPRLTGKYLNDVLESRWLTTGDECHRLKHDLAGYLGLSSASSSRICLGSSATACFQAILDLLASRGAESVDISQSTWIGMHQAISHANLMHGRSERTIAVFTHIGGRNLLGDNPRYEGQWNVGDYCHSWARPLSSNDFTIYSFYPTKLVPGAEGGAVVCKNPEDAELLERWLYCGIIPGEGVADALVMGRKANMTDVQAALNREALEVSPAYQEGIRQSWLQMAAAAEMWEVPFFQQFKNRYLFQVKVDDVPAVRRRLKAHGVPTAWNFPPAKLVTLPMWPNMEPDMASTILHRVKEAL